jgi:PRTRC genetic system protein B
LQDALCEPPQLVLSFFSYGILMRKATGNGGYTEYPVDAAAIAQALSAKICFDTGLMSDDVLLVQREGLREVVVSYRKPQKTGLWLEGSSEPVRVPLPGLVMIRTHSGSNPQYSLFAVKKRPETLDTPLFHAPLPNVFHGGNICWGNVRLTVEQGTSLAADWKLLLGTAFGTHSVGGKSKLHSQDVRQMLLYLAQEKKRTYPKRDLIEVHKTLRDVIGKESPYG